MGNTRPAHSSGWQCPVHPHACGEYGCGAKLCLGLVGSSPRVWGIRAWLNTKRQDNRFIPTRVGNTENNGDLKTSATVHPHACGEYANNKAVPRHSPGSSPRVWGIQAEALSKKIINRFIPTRVGNTGRSP